MTTRAPSRTFRLWVPKKGGAMRGAAGWIALACLIGSAWRAAGQESAPDPPPADDEAATREAPADEPTPVPGVDPLPAPPPVAPVRDAPADVDIGLGTRLALGAGVSRPLGFAAGVRILHGLSADVREDDGRVRAVCAVPISHCGRGFLLEAEAGSGGGKLSLGLGARARVDEPEFHGTIGIALRASVARTWGSPLGTEPGLTYVGPELDLTVVHVRLSVGVMWRVSGDTGASGLFTWVLGLGL